ncbi:hypothetical protein ACFQV2_33870 [Actinokineospora soli]|uniref:Uncharacterized protein n=1 Tax=Actinokineospora soli TaxID=1048753 RepID=A0ABW2TUW2_9PSEU
MRTPSDHHDPHEGNPWGFTLLTPPDANPSTMLFCSDLSVPDPDYG